MADEKFDRLPEKESPKPSKPAVDKAKYFELHLIDVAIEAYRKKEYLKAAMMSWSFVEEFFLPTAIDFVSKKQEIKVDIILEKAKGIQLINYYYLISLDEEVYLKLCKANSLRNKVVHRSYKSKSIKEIAENCKKSADCNFDVFSLAAKRLSGEVVYPSLDLYAKGWNDYRKFTLESLNKRKKELEIELDEIKKQRAH